MYQIKSVDKVVIRNGYEIAVKGDLCEVRDRESRVQHAGTLESCKDWLRERTLID
jgi:hypothetical protein